MNHRDGFCKGGREGSPGSWGLYPLMFMWLLLSVLMRAVQPRLRGGGLCWVRPGEPEQAAVERTPHPAIHRFHAFVADRAAGAGADALVPRA